MWHEQSSRSVRANPRLPLVKIGTCTSVPFHLHSRGNFLELNTNSTAPCWVHHHAAVQLMIAGKETILL
jgi:hypothetical protein